MRVRSPGRRSTRAGGGGHAPVRPTLAAVNGVGYGLGDLRRVRAVTQVELAQRLEVSQATVSKFERSSPEVTTIRRYVEALGGELEIVAVFNDDRMPLSY